MILSKEMVEALEAMRIAHGLYMTAEPRTKAEREAKMQYEWAAVAVVIAWEEDPDRVSRAMLSLPRLVDGGDL